MHSNGAARDASAKVFTRRQWLYHVSIPALTAGAMNLGERKSDARSTAASGSGSDLGPRVYNVRDFGAKDDGKTLDTHALQAAVDTCRWRYSARARGDVPHRHGGTQEQRTRAYC
jgi:polygalacturonase